MATLLHVRCVVLCALCMFPSPSALSQELDHFCWAPGITMGDGTTRHYTRVLLLADTTGAALSSPSAGLKLGRRVVYVCVSFVSSRTYKTKL